MANKRIKIVSRDPKSSKPSSAVRVPSLALEKLKKYKWLFNLKKSWLIFIPIAVVILVVSLWGFSQKNERDDSRTEESILIVESKVPTSKISDVDFHVFRIDDDFYTALKILKVSRKSIPAIMDIAKDEIPKNDLKGARISLYSNPSGFDYLTFEPQNKDYQLRITIGDNIQLEKSEKIQKTITERRAHLVTRNNLYESLSGADFRQFFIEDLFNLLAWNIDVSRVTSKNKFKLKVIYQSSYSDSIIDSIRIHAIQFHNYGEQYEFYKFKDNLFYDNKGRSAHKMFLKAPIDYKRISSEYGNRIHPIKGFAHVHKGIDYAAPEGTNIHALADGVITRLGFTSGNGNFIKIRHDETYETQYLHMKTFAPNMSNGAIVKQGQLIGYVGSTGSAKGDHVCLRFWKYGKQVDFLNEPNPEAYKLSRKMLDEFNQVRDSLKLQIQNIAYE